jgi:ribosomal protein S27AE
MPSIKQWKRLLDNKFEKGEDIPKIIKRCPQCNNLSLTYDPKTGKISCSKCGYEQDLKMAE